MQTIFHLKIKLKNLCYLSFLCFSLETMKNIKFIKERKELEEWTGNHYLITLREVVNFNC